MSKPAFNPNKPFNVVDDKPAFDPSKPFSTVEDTSVPKVLNEAHPAIDWTERMAVKNLGTDPMSSIGYLKSRHPDMEFGQDENGDITARATGEKDWRKLDPSTLEWKDISDVAWDISSGIVQGVATAAGGLAGGLPGAMVAGSGSGAGLEAVRQYLGKLANVNQEMSGGDIGFAAGVGAAAPLLFGTGATAAQQAKYLGSSGGALNALKAAGSVGRFGMGIDTAEAGGKSAVNRILTSADELLPSQALETPTKQMTASAAEYLAEQQRSGLGRFGSAAREKFSGLPREDVKAVARKYDLLDKFAKEGLDPHYQKKEAELSEAIFKHTANAQKVVGDALAKSNTTFDAHTLAAPLLEHKDDLLAIAETMRSDGADDAANEVVGIINKYLMQKERAVPIGPTAPRVPLEPLSAQNALNLKAQISDLVEYASTGGYKSLEGRSPVDKRTIGALRRTAENITKAVDAAISDKGQSVMKVYKEAKDVERLLLPKLKREGGFAKIVSDFGRKKNAGLGKRLEDLGNKIGFDFKDIGEDAYLYKRYVDPEWTPTSGAGTSTSKTIPVYGFGSAIGQMLSRAAGVEGSGAFLAGAAGGAAANAAISPAAAKMLGRASNALEYKRPGLYRGLKQTQAIGARAATPWINMKTSGGE